MPPPHMYDGLGPEKCGTNHYIVFRRKYLSILSFSIFFLLWTKTNCCKWKGFLTPETYRYPMSTRYAHTFPLRSFTMLVFFIFILIDDETTTVMCTDPAAMKIAPYQKPCLACLLWRIVRSNLESLI